MYQNPLQMDTENLLKLRN